MTTENPKYSRLFYEASRLFGRKFGVPLPQRVLEIGDTENGWHLKLNVTKAEADGIPPFGILAKWNGWPAGIIEVGGGVMVAGDAANEDSLIEWIGKENER